nr:translation initiation factor 1 [Pieris japonica]BDD17186.1 translation initiation factor 1 [Pieris japonica]BDD17200.1 translation initiation factor 1 [Pieris japonica]BDD17214.1 translation initiation factor 1 [Pieris japonica]BDD17242.1 translation initiation factor 1 [Pieris japonica]
MTKKEEKRIYEGLITESFPDGKFRVLLENDDDKVDNHNTDIILGYISGNIRRRFIRILPGDRVKIEVSKYDPARGRIIQRLPVKKASENLNKALEDLNKVSEDINKASENPNKTPEN